MTLVPNAERRTMIEGETTAPNAGAKPPLPNARSLAAPYSAAAERAQQHTLGVVMRGSETNLSALLQEIVRQAERRGVRVVYRASRGPLLLEDDVATGSLEVTEGRATPGGGVWRPWG